MHPLLGKKGFILDVDGVICRGRKPIKEGVEAVRKLKDLGKKIVFVSNNSTRSRTIMIDRFNRFGIEVSEDEMLLATFATARYLKREAGKAKIHQKGT